jgi:rhodanese-related sulfurtransferase
VNPWDVPTVDPRELPEGALLLDVREGEEWNAGHIEGALHVPMNTLPNKLAYEPGVITPDVAIVVVCKMGGRSAQVTAWLNQQGYNAVNLDGGMLAWAQAGRPMRSEDGRTPTVL